MARAEITVLENHFSKLVDSFTSEFDTHDFIRRLAHRHQRDYIAALVAFQDQAHPFNVLHGQIGWLLGQHPELVSKVGERDSEDIFGQRNSAVVWRKV